LKHNTTLTSLNLLGDAIGNEGAQEVAEALKHNTTLTKLSLWLNDIGTGGAKAIAEALKYNKSLNSLDLTSNEIGSEGVKVVGESLKHNMTLTELYLSNNDIDSEGVKAITEALKYNTTLTTLDIENADSSGQITRELNKNKNLLETQKSAKAAFEIIKNRLDARGVLEDTFYPQEIMDEVLTQMIQMGLKQEVIDLGNEITPPEKSPKS
jgi:Ran GTPase-activating protein (RanGAP) involved in mRNA processing and transport